MCGIAGLLSVERPIDAELIEAVLRMLDRQTHRGPDDWGILIPDGVKDEPAVRALLEPRGWDHVRTYPGSGVAPAAVLGSRRLSIIDVTTAGRMPLTTADGRIAVVYNGEIYNFRELRDELSRAGHTFRSKTDTEVLIHGYQQWGEDLPRHLRGMYAFVILDARTPADPKLFAVKDRFGIKPLYWARHDCVFQFASEVRALMAGGLVPAAPEPRGINGFLTYGTVPTPWTTVRGVMSLPAAESLFVDHRRYSFPAPSRYWQPPDIDDRLSAGEAATQTRDLLASAVHEQLVSDVPVGVFLSGGMDSSAIVALASRAHAQPLTTLCVSFDEAEFSEAPYARVVADRFNTNHTEVRVRADDFVAELPRLFDAMDQPTIDGVNTYFVARAARHAGLTVVLSGVGGDELFHGYPGFRHYPLIRRLQRMPLAGRFVSLAARALRGLGRRHVERAEFLAEHPVLGPYLATRGLFPPRIAAALLQAGRLPIWHDGESALADDAAQFGRLELAYYTQNQLLRDTDVFAMRHSVEVRVPFLDHRLVELIARLPSRVIQCGRAPKPLLAAALGDDYPAGVATRRKMGFVLPMAAWVRRTVAPLAATDRQPQSRIADADFDRVVRDYQRGRRHWSQLWALVVLRAAEQRFLVPSYPADSGPRRLLFVAPQVYGAGGISTYTQGLLRAVAETFPATELHVVSLNDDGRDVAQAIRGRVHFYGAGPRGGLRYRLRAGTMILLVASRARPDTVVSGHINVAPLTLVLSTLCRARNLLTTYGVEVWSPPAWLRASARRVDQVFAISAYTAGRLRAWGVPPERITLLPCMVDGEVFRPIPPDAPNGTYTVLTVARLDSSEKYKGIDNVLAAVARLRSIRPVRYVVAGAGDDLARLRALAASLGLRDAVQFKGFVPPEDLPALYSAADLFVMPSKKEGFGIVFLESLACGTPVVAGNQDGSLDALNQGSWGRIVSPDSVQEICNAIAEGPNSVPERRALLAAFGPASSQLRLRRALSVPN